MPEPTFPIKLMLERFADFTDQSILPAMTDPVLLQKAFFMSTALRILANSVEEKAGDMVVENKAMAEVMGNVMAKLQREDTLSQNRVKNDLVNTIEGALKGIEAGEADPVRKNRDLMEALVDTIKGLDALRDLMPEQTMSSLKQQIRSLLRRQVDHGIAHLDGVPLGF